MTLAERLRELRSERGWRLKDLSEQSGLSVPYLSDLERGRTNPSLETLNTLARTYAMSVQDLLEPTDFAGERTPAALPKGLAELLADPILGKEITPDWQKPSRVSSCAANGLSPSATGTKFSSICGGFWKAEPIGATVDAVPAQAVA